jgi:hypothetical protein
MSESLDPLKVTTQELHRFYFEVATARQWYSVMNECRKEFGKNWKCQGKVLHKLNRASWRQPTSLFVWFDIPNASLATFIAVKLGLNVRKDKPKTPINN